MMATVATVVLRLPSHWAAAVATAAQLLRAGTARRPPVPRQPETPATAGCTAALGPIVSSATGVRTGTAATVAPPRLPRPAATLGRRERPELPATAATPVRPQQAAPPAVVGSLVVRVVT